MFAVIAGGALLIGFPIGYFLDRLAQRRAE